MAKSTIRPDNLIWVVVGDHAKIEAGIRQLGLGEVKFFDANGIRCRARNVGLEIRTPLGNPVPGSVTGGFSEASLCVSADLELFVT